MADPPSAIPGRTAIGRALGYILLFLVVQILARTLAVAATGNAGLSDIRFLAIYATASALMTVPATAAYANIVHKQKLATFGLRFDPAAVRELIYGITAAVLAMSVIFAIADLSGWVNVSGLILHNPSINAAHLIGLSLLTMSAVAVTEEIAVRGYILQTLESGYGIRAAMIVSSILFGAAHLTNTGAGWTAWVGTTTAGLALACAYLVTRRLWMPIGIHFGWNYALAAIYGFPASGIRVPSWIQISTHGPNLWLGGEFGPESGLSGLLVVLLVALAIALYKKYWISRSDTVPRPPTPGP